MTKTGRSYREGDWFVVPLRGDDGYALGLAARVDGRGGLIGYFFGPRLPDADAAQVEGRQADQAVLVANCGDLGLKRGTWRVVGAETGWDRGRWPMPRFGRVDVLDPRVAYRVTYDERDLTFPIFQEPIDPQLARSLPEDGVWGAGAVERRLARLLAGGRAGS